ncbi:dynamin GTPase [Sarracenia purpurea var. burkii]
MKEKSSQQDKDVQEGSGLKTAGPDGEITAGFCFFALMPKTGLKPGVHKHLGRSWLDTMARRPVLNSLAANVPKAVV